MSNLKDIKPSILELEDSVVIDLIRRLRQSRRTVKVKAIKSSTASKPKASTRSMLDRLTPEQAQMLLDKISKR